MKLKFKKTIILLVLFVVSTSFLVAGSEIDRKQQIRWRTVRLRIVKKEYRDNKPWMAPKVYVITGSGFYLGKGRILTDLELIRNASQVTAFFLTDDQEYDVKISHLGYDCGLALLTFKVVKLENESQSKKDDVTSNKTKVKKEEKQGPAHDDSIPRKLDLNLLKKSDTDIPFVEFVDKVKEKIDAKKRLQKKRVSATHLPALSFSLTSLLPGHDLVLNGFVSPKRNDSLNVRFIAHEFVSLDNTDIDFHWIYRIQRLKQDISKSQSGGPVTLKNRIIGISHIQTNKKAYVIPSSVIQSFLSDVNDGIYHGLKSSGLVYKRILNPARRKYLGLNKNEGGLQVTSVVLGRPISNQIQQGDILLRLDTKIIDDRGMITLENRDWNVEEYLRSRRRVNKTVRALIIRGSKRLSLPLSIASAPKLHYGRSTMKGSQQYFLGAGVVFAKLNYNLVNQENLINNHKLQKFYINRIRNDQSSRSQSIVLTWRFPDPENIDSKIFKNEIVRMVNGRRIYNLEDLATEWKQTRKSHVIIEFFGRKDKLILPYSDYGNINKRTLRRYRLQENSRVH